MSEGYQHNSLDNLAHIANMSQELLALNQQLKDESGLDNRITTSFDGNSGNGGINRSNWISNDSTGNSSFKVTRPKRMACVECRQQKSRCDAHEKHPDPCTRCAKKGLKCDLKSDYKRTYKRARIAQIEREFSELKRNLTAQQLEELISKVPSLYEEGPAVTNENKDIITTNQPYPSNQPQNIPPLNKSSHPEPKPDNFDAKYQKSPPILLLPQQVLIGYERRNSKYSSDSNFSIPNTPSIQKPQDQSETNRHKSSKVVVPNEMLACEEKRIDTITLSPDNIKSLFVEYVDHYHPILPVVDVLKGPERIHRLCPSLFWVIMVVSLRRYRDESEKSLLLHLSPIVKDILAQVTISPITRYNPTEEDEPLLNVCSVYSVQAFLLYTFWPPITSSLSADSSWNTIGVGMYQAIRIGLNLPLITSSDTKASEQKISMAEEQSRTWAICNSVSQTIATSFGLPAFVQFDSTTWSVNSSKIKLGNTVRLMLEISQFEDQVAKTLNSNPFDSYGLLDPTERLPLIKVLLKQLSELEMKMTNDFHADDCYRRFQLLAARVHLLTYYFMDSSRMADFELHSGLVRLYNSAVALINHAQYCHTNNKTFARYLPVVYVLNIWQASFIVGKLAHSPLKKFLDLGSGKQSYLAAVGLAAKASILRHDIAYRSSGIMRSMWQLFRTLDDKKLSTLGIEIRSRMSASVFFDCLYLLRTQVGMIKFNIKNDITQEAAIENEAEDDEDVDDEDDETLVNAAVAKDRVRDGNQPLVSEGEDEKLEDNKSTPGSNSSRGKKKRSLSSTENAESKARRIIRTIPLDPQPIPANVRSNRFKSSNESSPLFNSEKNTPVNTTFPSNNLLGFSPSTGGKVPFTRTIQAENSNSGPPQNQNKAAYIQSPQGPQKGDAPLLPQASPTNSFGVGTSTFKTPIASRLDNLELDVFDINSDLIWKDVDSVMNEFGFHT